MISRFLKTVAFPLLAAVLIGLGVGTLSAGAAGPNPSGPGPQPVTKFDIEQIVHSYIVDNPKLIMDAMNNYQFKNGAGMAGGGAGAGAPQGGPRGKAIDPDAMQKNQQALVKDSGSPVVGNPNGDVTVIEFMDYNCHYCKDALPTIQSLLESDKKVRVVFKDFPILGPASETAAKWAIAAHKQKKYFAFHSALMKNKAPLNDDVLASLAGEAGLDVDQMKKDAESSDVQAQLEKNKALGSDIGVRGTPAFIIGDELTPGAMQLPMIQQKLEEQRKKKAK